MNLTEILVSALEAAPGFRTDVVVRVPGQPDRTIKARMDVSLEGTSLGTVSTRLFRRTCEVHSSRLPEVPDGTRMEVDGTLYDVQAAPELSRGGWWTCGLVPAGMLWRGR